MAKTTEVLLEVPQGATYTHTFTYVDAADMPVPLVDYTARMQIRAALNSSTVIHEATTENGGITITPSAGEVVVVLSAVTTAAFTFVSAVYDLELIAPDSTIVRLVKGRIRLDPEVTR